MSLHRRRPTMLVTGASGLLGRHLVRLQSLRDWEIMTPTSRQLDIADRSATLRIVADRTPDVVVHLAYRKGDREVIVDGSRNVAEAADATGARLIHMSTDLVFGGRPTPYVESDRPDPIIDYGKHKADAEAAVLGTVADALIIRTSLLYGTDHPSPFQIDLAAGLRWGTSPMTFFTDEVRCPAHAADVAAAIARVAPRSDIVGILHVAGPEPVSRLDLATALARFAGAGDISLPASTIAESGMVRAGNIVLDTSLATSLGISCAGLADRAVSS